jgi:hypothetical protein
VETGAVEANVCQFLLRELENVNPDYLDFLQDFLEIFPEKL